MNSKKLKGFTLVELIVVIAIIAILAGIMSLAIEGFQLSSRTEANNNRAQIVYSGMQNCLIQCEINQDSSILYVPGNTTQSYSVIKFRTYDGGVGSTINVSDSLSSGTDIIAGGTYDEQYVKLKNVITSFLSPTFTGSFAVYMDLEDFVVDSVVFAEDSVDLSDLESSTLSGNELIAYNFNSSSTSTESYTFESYNDLITSIRHHGVYYGVYPYKPQS